MKDRYGTLTPASPDHEDYCPRTLIVFVHGIMASASSTWPELPGWVMKQARVQADVFLYDYPAWFWQTGSIEGAAKDLTTSLSANLDRYDHLVFVTHSNGGLVVKQMLLDDFQSTEARLEAGSTDPSLDREDLKSIVLRTRRVMHLAVPHRGGNWLLTLLGTPFVPVLKLASLLFLLLRLVSFGALRWGYQRTFWQIRHRSKILVELDQNLRWHEQRFVERRLERPVFVDIAADTDLAIANQVSDSRPGVDVIGHEAALHLLDQRSRWTLRGNHMSVKVPKTPQDPVVKILGDEIGCFSPSWRWMVAHATTARVFRLHQQLDVNKLVSGQAPEPLASERARRDSSLRVSRRVQADALATIGDFVAQGAARPRCVVLTGDAGVGKSTVIRSLARDLAVSFMRDDRHLPITLPLQDITLSADAARHVKSGDPLEQGERLLQALLEDWCRWLDTLLFEDAVRPDEVHESLRSARCVLILDSVDEFLLNNPGFELLHFRRIGDWVKREYRQNGSLTLVYGVRKTQVGWDMLVSTDDVAVEVPRLTREQAVILEPRARNLTDLEDERLQSVLLTPLYRTLWTEFAERSDGAALTHAGLLELLLTSLIRKSGLLEASDRDGQPVNERMWLDALTLMGWLFFRSFRRNGRVGLAVLRRELTELREEWKVHRASTRADTAKEVAGQMLSAFELLQDANLLDALLSRTIFLPTGSKDSPSVRVMHREHLAACRTFDVSPLFSTIALFSSKL